MTTLAEAAERWREWFDRGEFDEGAARVREALESPDADERSVERVRVLYAAHLFAFRRGEPSASFASEAFEMAEKLGDVRGQSEGLTGLARAALRDGDYAKVTTYAASGLEVARLSGDRAAERSPLHLYAAGARLSGNYDLALDLYMQSLELGYELGDERWKQMEFHNLGWVQLHRGDVDQAAQMFAERDALTGKDAYADAWTNLNRAAVAAARGSLEDALSLFNSGKQQLENLGAVLDPDDQVEFDWLSRQLAT